VPWGRLLICPTKPARLKTEKKLLPNAVNAVYAVASFSVSPLGP